MSLIEWRGADEPTDHIMDHYFSPFAGLDPFPYFSTTPGRVLTVRELMDRDYRTHPYFVEFLEPHGLGHMLLFHIIEPHGHQAWVTLTRPRHREPFQAESIKLGARLAPHSPRRCDPMASSRQHA